MFKYNKILFVGVDMYSAHFVKYELDVAGMGHRAPHERVRKIPTDVASLGDEKVNGLKSMYVLFGSPLVGEIQPGGLLYCAAQGWRGALARTISAISGLVNEATRLELLNDAGVDNLIEVTSMKPLTWPPRAELYVQPTGSVPWSNTFRILKRADHVVLNKDELFAEAIAAGVSVRPEYTYGPKVFLSAASVLDSLHSMRFAGRCSAVVTFGRLGCLAADWNDGRYYSLRFQPFAQESDEVTPPSVSGLFLGAYAYYYSTWANRGFLRHPVMAAALRAAHFVAAQLKISPNSDEISAETISLGESKAQ